MAHCTTCLQDLSIIASAVQLWRGKPSGSLIYGGLLVVTIVWAQNEAGTNLWALAPRILPFAALGLWFLTPWLRKALYVGELVPPLFQSPYAKGAVAVIGLAAIVVVIAGTGFEITPMSARAGVTEVNARTDWPSYGNTRKELWQHDLPNIAQSTPMSYLSPQSKQQTIVVTVPVNSRVTSPEAEDPLGGYIIAYRLPN